MGRNLGNFLFVICELLLSICECELEEVCKVIGIIDLRKMGLCDKIVEFEFYEYIDGMIKFLIDDINLLLIILFYFGYVVYFDYEVIVDVVIWMVECMFKEECFCLILVVFSNDVIEVFGEFDI